MISKEQLAEEQKKERQFNALFEQVISKTPFGQWYPLMIGASRMLTNNLPKRVGIEPDGRPIVVYKTKSGKFIGTFATPTHELLAKDLSQKKWKEALTTVLSGGISTKIKNIQRQKKAKIFDISPDDVKRLYEKKLALEKSQAKRGINPIKTSQKPPTTNYNKDFEDIDFVPVPIDDKKTNYTPLIVFSLVGIVVLIGAVTLSKKS